MTDNIEYLTREQFRALKNQIEGMQTKIRDESSDMKHRFNRLESAVAGVRRDEAGTAEEMPGSNRVTTGSRGVSTPSNTGWKFRRWTDFFSFARQSTC